MALAFSGASVASGVYKGGKPAAYPILYTHTPSPPQLDLDKLLDWGAHTGVPSDLCNCLWLVINSARVLLMRGKNVEIAASLFCCKMLIKKSLVLCVSPTLRKEVLCSCKCRIPAYPATANEVYVYVPLAFSFLQWELLVMKAAAVFAHRSTSSSQRCPECRQPLQAV